MLEDCTFRFSQWDPATTRRSISAPPEQWDEAQSIMGKILDDLQRKVHHRHRRGRLLRPQAGHPVSRTSSARKTPSSPFRSTMLLAEQFGMEYVDADGKKKRPYIIHRTSLGCYERTLAYLIEKYAGALPPVDDAHRAGAHPAHHRPGPRLC